MQTYVINNDPNMALKILDEMVEKGLTPDLATYTTLINCFRKGRKL
jgi:pentatricopeptide repeat protein